jgi:hypothetical protein
MLCVRANASISRLESASWNIWPDVMRAATRVRNSSRMPTGSDCIARPSFAPNGAGMRWDDSGSARVKSSDRLIADRLIAEFQCGVEGATRLPLARSGRSLRVELLPWL